MRRWVNAIEIGSVAQKRIQGKRSGVVRSVFNRTLILMTRREEAICVVRRDVPINPTNIVTDLQKNIDFTDLGFEIDTPFSISNDLLRIGDKLVVSLADAKVWNPVFPRNIRSRERVQENLGFVVELVERNGNLTGLGELIPFLEEILDGRDCKLNLSNMYARAAAPRIVGLIQGIQKGDLTNVRKNAEDLFGLGPGLTPSADDMLAGVMLGLLALTESNRRRIDYILDINRIIVAGAAKKTNWYSCDLLTHASRGLGSQPLMRLLQVVLTGERIEISKAVRKVLSVGATSGTDTVLGILLGVHLGLSLSRIPST